MASKITIKGAGVGTNAIFVDGVRVGEITGSRYWWRGQPQGDGYTVTINGQVVGGGTYFADAARFARSYLTQKGA